MFRRHPIITLLCLLLLALVGAVGYILATFDLGNYRHQLAARLGQALKTPVSLGDAHLSLSRGLAIAFDDLKIGDDASRIALSAEHLSLRIEIIPLLQRRLSFSAVVLDTPQVVLRPPAEEIVGAEAGPPRDNPFLSLLQRTRLKSLEIQDGRFEWQRLNGDPPPVILEKVAVELDRLALAQSAQLSISAKLLQNGQSARFDLSGSLEPPTNWGHWFEWQTRLKARGQDLALAALQQRGMPEVVPAGTVDLQLELEGSAAAGIALRGQVEGRVGKAASAGRGLARLSASAAGTGRWQDGQWRLTLETARINQWPVTGPLHLVQSQQAWLLQGGLTSQKTDLTAIRHLLQTLALRLPQPHRDLRPTGGTLTLVGLTVDGPWPDTTAGWLGPDGTLRSAELKIEGLALEQAGGGIEGGSATLGYDRGQLEIDRGFLRWRGIPCRFQGSLSGLGGSSPTLDLKAQADAPAGQLATLLADLLPPEVHLEGPATTSLELSGPLQRPRYKLQADLSAMTASWQTFLGKPQGAPANLQIAGEWQGDRLAIASGEVRLGPVQAAIQGSIENRPTHPFQLAFRMDAVDLSRLEQLIPSLQPFKLAGELQGTLDLSGSTRALEPPRGDFTLRGGGAHFGDIVADLNSTRGRILLRGPAVEAPALTTRLGQSSFSVSARIADLSAPRLEIDLQGENLRPKDLIFTGDARPLERVAGTLVIHRDGIDFNPVRARTAGGTVATVTGAVHSYRSPLVDLKIDADYGNVDEILQFFQRPPEARRAEEERPARTRVHIEVNTRAGVFHQIDFGQANATITYRDRVLEIYPLHADLKPGYYVGRVLWAGSEDAPLLKVSGHLEEVDAEAAYHSQTRKYGLITGRLRADFYLEGAGGNFWPTSHGGLSFEVRDGVLRRFPVLSKVFSLLNVSQIFNLRLPDMAQEGMPFESITGNLRLVEGTLSSEDVLVNSNAMNLSVVGKIDLGESTIDATLGVKPLGTVDKIVTRIPIAGWILGGEEKALIVAHFQVTGHLDNPRVDPVPITSVSKKVQGIFKRVFGLPAKVFSDIGEAVGGGDQEPK